jgi:hypothetical protein
MQFSTKFSVGSISFMIFCPQASSFRSDAAQVGGAAA